MEMLLKQNCNANEISPLTLAFVGDGVYDLLVREYLVKCANRPVGELNRRKVALVCCAAQAKFYTLLESKLTDKELSVYKRGRNATPNSTPKNATLAQYHSATGLEALFGYLYLDGQNERLRELFGMITDESEKEFF